MSGPLSLLLRLLCEVLIADLVEPEDPGCPGELTRGRGTHGHPVGAGHKAATVGA